MTPTRTDSQRTASRLNGSLSKGPTTPEGRLTSSRNSTKHGLTGDGKHLPPDMELELQSEIAIYSTRYLPQDDFERRIIRRAALADLRTRRIASTYNALVDDRIRNAIRLWDETRADEVARLADKLPHSPATTLPLLRRLTEGCDYLADSWESLAQSLRDQGFLDDAQSLKVFHLLGHTEPPSLKDEANPLTDLWLTLLSLQFDHNPKPLLRTTLRHLSPPDSMRRPPESVRTPPEIVRSHLPDPSTARTDLAQFLADQVSALESEAAHLWETYDLPSRQSAPTRAAFKPSPDLILLDRYLTAAERMRRHALTELSLLRRDQARGLIPPTSPDPAPPVPPPVTTPPVPSPTPIPNEPTPPFRSSQPLVNSPLTPLPPTWLDHLPPLPSPSRPSPPQSHSSP